MAYRRGVGWYTARAGWAILAPPTGQSVSARPALPPLDRPASPLALPPAGHLLLARDNLASVQAVPLPRKLGFVNVQVGPLLRADVWH